MAICHELVQAQCQEWLSLNNFVLKMYFKKIAKKVYTLSIWEGGGTSLKKKKKKRMSNSSTLCFFLFFCLFAVELRVRLFQHLPLVRGT